MNIQSDVGTKIKFLNRNGYDWELKRAQELFNTTEVYEVEEMDVGSFNSSVKVKGVVGKHNTVMFENVDDDYERRDWYGENYPLFKTTPR